MFESIQKPLQDAKVGMYAFWLALLLSVVLAVAKSVVAAYIDLITVLLVVLGLLIGWLNVKSDVQTFLVAAIALVLVQGGGIIAFDSLVSPIGTILKAFVVSVISWVMPAVVIASLRVVLNKLKG